MAQREDRGAATYDLRLARFYMWAQTAATVFLACRVPTGAAPARGAAGTALAAALRCLLCRLLLLLLLLLPGA